MDFLRSRQMARERAPQRGDEQPAPDATPDRPAMGSGPTEIAAVDDAVSRARPSRGSGPTESIQDALRAELEIAAAPEEADATGPVRADALPPASVEPEPDDPLDEFFWREDEAAPSLPEFVAASALPQARVPPEVRREWLTFRLGGEEFAIAIEHVREIIKRPAITEVPRAPAHVIGVLMVRGEVVAVFDPRRRLGLPAGDPGRKGRILVCDTGDGPRGLLVDAVSQVVRLAPSSIEPRPSSIGGAAADYISGIGRDRERLFVLLDAAALLGDAHAPPGEARR